MPKNLPGVLFDLDGTLTNPFEGITKGIRYAMERMGEEPPLAADLHWCIGPPLQHSFARLLDTDDKGRITDAVAFYRERYGEVGKFENSLIDGIPAAGPARLRGHLQAGDLFGPDRRAFRPCPVLSHGAWLGP
ncbi:HAD hydrolase-like protein [Nitratireductor luteus]|uniref:HAD hydrolase-like protein n=1 Tax=Nitratireductor luteus TaxID=2976980 RepID=UPI00223FA692|nr:HAD hydrolase-like protein [Nitratireductor luteus]